MTVEQQTARLRQIASDQPYPLVFVTVSGAHLYGFASPDSDYDLRGVHVLPPDDLVGLYEPTRTIEVSREPASADDIELDLVTHDAGKFMQLMLKRNGYVLEQLFSPLVICTSPEHAELKAIGQRCITRHHAHHYLGFARTQWKLFAKENPPRVKPLLYLYRVLLTGLHLMRTGRIEANLVELNKHFELEWIDELLARKTTGSEHVTLEDAELSFHREQYDRLAAQLEQASESSHLPDRTDAKPALHDLLLRLRRP